MNEIICPNCNKAFKVDEAGFADIAKQVRNHEFEKEINNRLALANTEKDTAIKLASKVTKMRRKYFFLVMIILLHLHIIVGSPVF